MWWTINCLKREKALAEARYEAEHKAFTEYKTLAARVIETSEKLAHEYNDLERRHDLLNAWADSANDLLERLDTALVEQHDYAQRYHTPMDIRRLPLDN